MQDEPIYWLARADVAGTDIKAGDVVSQDIADPTHPFMVHRAIREAALLAALTAGALQPLIAPSAASPTRPDVRAARPPLRVVR